MKPVRILALQGDFKNHAETLNRIDVPSIEIREPAQLSEISALILPGGESTVMGKLMVRFGLLQPIRDLIDGGLPVFGTCAGMILLAREIDGSDQPNLGCLDIQVGRNAYGRQIESFEADITTHIAALPTVRGVFIRAPQVLRTGPGIETLATYKSRPVIIGYKNIIAASFHPELTDDSRMHRYFIDTFISDIRKV